MSCLCDSTTENAGRENAGQKADGEMDAEANLVTY